MSAHFFRELARGSARVNDRRAFAATPAETAVLLISGDADPVGENGEGVRTVSRRLEETGHDNVELRLYEGARHELLHETNRDEVREDILRWIDETGAACQKHGHQEE
jgi:alpha-beta hydrolase superfamily lysophospholipase